MADDENPFAAPETQPQAEAPTPLQDIPAAVGTNPRPLGPLVQAASFANVIEAEMARAHLTGAGIRAALRDEQVVGAYNVVGIVGGVKVDVMPADLERARELLETQRRNRGAGTIVFRVERKLTAIYGVLGMGVGGLAGVIASGVAGVPLLLPAMLVAGLVFGARIGSVGESHCSTSGCGRDLAPEMTECPGCGGRIAGVIGHPDERLAAEERLRKDKP